MPLCWIFLLKRRRALSNVSFSPTRTSANPGSPPQAKGLACTASCSRPAGSTRPRPVPRARALNSADRLAEHSRCPLVGQPARKRSLPRTIRGMTSAVGTILDLFDDAVTRYADRPALGMRGDDGGSQHWTYRELQRRSRIAAWRLRAAGLQPGDRILTGSLSTPELPAAYYGAMRAGLVIVPLDLRMAPDAIERIATRADTKRLILGTGRDAPNPRDAG